MSMRPKISNNRWRGAVCARRPCARRRPTAIARPLYRHWRRNKLAAYKRQNRLYFALAELGRIERTLFTLNWLDQSELRHACQAGLNKGEARHTLTAAIYTNRQGRFTDRSLENQEYRASGLNLLIAAISYWNMLYLDRAVQHLNTIGAESDHALLAHLSPMGWAHISLTGDYLWKQARNLAVGEFRPLNDPMTRLKLVA